MMVNNFDFEISQIHLKIAEISNFENRTKNQKISKIFKIWPKIQIWKISFFSIFRFFRKSSNIFTIISDFFTFLGDFFMDFTFFWCFEKLKLRSLRKVVRLFTKYASLGLCVAGFEKNTISMENHSVFWLKWHTQIVIWDQCFRQHSTPNLIDAIIFSRHKNFFNGSNRAGASVVCNLTCQRGRHAP